MNATQQLHNRGQSPWLDNMRRIAEKSAELTKARQA